MSRVTPASQVFPDPTFPLSVVRIASHSDTALHSHAFHELIIITGGRGKHVMAGGEYATRKGDVFVITGKTAHAYRDTDRLQLVNILFEPARLRLPLADVGRLPGYHVLFQVEPQLRQQHRFRGRLRLTGAQQAKAAHLVKRMEDELETHAPAYRAMASSHLTELICLLSRFYSERATEDHQPLLRIGEVLSFVERSYDEDITLQRLAAIAGMSESSLVRTFRRAVGTSPIEYALAVRIGRASEMLRNSDLRVSEIAFRCGFNDSNYFTRRFRKATGMAPRDYRARAFRR